MTFTENNPPENTTEYLQVFSPNISTSELAYQYQVARTLVESSLGVIQEAVIATGGLANHVYKIKGARQNGIVKIRGTHFATLPQIPLDPTEIIYEWTALELLSKLEPRIFPKPLAFDRATSMILMTDVIPTGKTLYQRLIENEVSPDEIKILGKTVATVHKKLSSVKESVRDGNDEKLEKQSLGNRFGYLHNPVLDNALIELQALPKQLILADLSPTNIGTGNEGQITICDLESFYKGNVIGVYGYLTGHILLHALANQANVEVFLQKLLNGFQAEENNIDFNSNLLKKITIGTVLYRLQSVLFPYNIPLSPDEKARKELVALRLLKEEMPSWSRIVEKLSHA